MRNVWCKKMSTDLDQALADPHNIIYFDSQTTGRRAEGIRKAVKAGKHIYCEKPIAVDTKQAMELYQLCKSSGVKNGVVQDKLWLPGIIKIKRLIQQGFLVKYFLYGESLAIGYLKAIQYLRSVHPGIIGRKMMEVLL